jgi:hypothetical protein
MQTSATVHIAVRQIPSLFRRGDPMSVRSQLPVAQSQFGLSREFDLTTRALRGFSLPDHGRSLVQSRRPGHPSAVSPRTGKTRTPSRLVAPRFRRRNPGQDCSRMLAARALITILSDAVSTAISRATVRVSRPSTQLLDVRFFSEIICGCSMFAYFFASAPGGARRRHQPVTRGHTHSKWWIPFT